MLKKWLIDNGFLAADAKDDGVDEAVEKAMKDGKLSIAQYKSLLTQKTPEEKVAEDRAAFIKQINDGHAANNDALLKGLAALLKPAEKVEEVVLEEKTSDLDIESKIAEAVSKAIAAQKASDHQVEKVFKLAATFNDEKDPDTVRVKRSAERYSDTKTARLHKKGLFAGQPMVLECRGNKSVDVPSQLDNALFHAWFKLETAPGHLTDADKDLIAYIAETKTFVGLDAGRTDARRLNAEEIASLKNSLNTGVKVALLDDSTSGGQHATPEFYDTNAILVPLHSGELSPFVTVKEVPRGSAVESWSIGLPSTVSTAEGTGITAFDATSLIGDFTVPIFPASCFIEIGKDFMSDASPNVGSDIQNQIAEVFAAWADEQIAVGDGTTEPQGIMNASSTIAVASQNGTGGPLDIIDLVNLYFGVDKSHRQKFGSRMRFGMTDVTYKRFKSLQTGISQDDRLLFGDNLNAYSFLGTGVGTPYSGMTNSQVFCCNMGGYRWYRRQGVRFVTEDRGSTLTLKNTMLVGARTRNGGKLERGQYAAVMVTAQS